MIADKKEFSLGVGMLIVFFIVLGAILSPIFKGQNGLDYLDNMYNSISKGSAYYVDTMLEKSKKFAGKNISASLTVKDEKQTQQIVQLFTAAGAEVKLTEKVINIQGDLGNILNAALVDSEAMYNNDADTMTSKYGNDPRSSLFNWWSALKEMDKDLKRQKFFEEASMVSTVNKKAVETCYNYYGIEAKSIKQSILPVALSLIFYVIYTMWYGFSILFLFEGWGLRISH